MFGTLITHAYDAREALTSNRYIHIIHAYGFTMVLWYKATTYDLLVLNKLREMEYLIQVVFASKVGVD